MKKTILVLILLAILGSGAYYLFRTYGPTNPARYLPESTIAYASFNDIPRSARRWQQTELAKISEEPSVREFLKKPLEKLGEAGKNEAEAILREIKPSRLFCAVTSIQATNISWVGGFQYYGGTKSLQHALDRLREHLNSALPLAEHTVSQYEGVEITKSQHGLLTLFTATKGVWCFLSNDEKALHEVLDRHAGRNTTPAFSTNADFQKGLAELPRDPDFTGYLNVQPLLETLLTTGKSLGATANPRQEEQARKVKSISSSFKIDGPILRDSFFVQTTDISTSRFEHKTIHYTTPETLLYYGAQFKWPNLQDGVTAFIPANILTSLTEQHLETVNLTEVFGPEFGLSVSWPQSKFTPELLISIPLVNPDVAKKLIETVSASVFPQMIVSDDANAHYYSYPSVSNPLLNPSLAITKDFLLFGMTDAEVHAAAAKSADSPNLETSPNFQTIKNIYQDANESFGYIDSKVVFDRGYNALKPVLTFGAAMMPAIAEYIDTAKLPDSSAISAHLTPITIDQRRVPGGVFMESSGPVTLHQFCLISAGAWLASRPKP
ncbi:MAG: DUF3352 domain-containing protein [Chthoniobacterales bacterium]